MKKDRLEEKFSKAFESHRPELDHDQLWQRIEPHLPVRRRRRPLFWMLGGFVLAGGLSYLMWSVGAKNAPAAMANQWAVSSVPAAPLSTDANTISKSAVTNPMATGTSLSTAAPTVTNETTASVLPGKTRSIRGQKQSPAGPITAVDLLPQPIAKNQPLVTNNTFPKPLPITEANIKTASPVLQLQLPYPEWLDHTMPMLEQSVPNKLKLPAALPIVNVPPTAYTVVDFYFSPDVTIDQMSDYDNEGLLTELRQRSEHKLESFSAGIRLQRFRESGLVWSIGMDYRQVNAKLEVREEIEELILLSNGIKSVLEDAGGAQRPWKVGPKNATRITLHERDTYNNYLSLNLPVGLGLHFRHYRARVQLMAGMDVNLFFIADGELLNARGEVDRLKALQGENPRFYKRNTGFGAWASASYAYSLSRQWSVFASPYFRWQLGDQTVRNYGLMHRQHSVGLRLGLRYHVNMP